MKGSTKASAKGALEDHIRNQRRKSKADGVKEKETQKMDKEEVVAPKYGRI